MQKKYVELPSLTIGRGVAALVVAFHHLAPVLANPMGFLTSIGWLGVSFFFILSGFVLTWSFDSQITYKRFMLNRLSRIYPLHIIGIAVCVLAYFTVGSPLAGYPTSLGNTFFSLFLVHSWGVDNPEIRQSWDGVSWTLSVEFFFYLLAPFLIRASANMSSTALINVSIALFFIYIFAGSLATAHGMVWILDAMNFNPVARLPEFIYGITACRLIQRGLVVKFTYVQKAISFLPYLIYNYVFGFTAANDPISIALVIPPFIMLIIGGASSDITAHHAGIKIRKGFLQKLGEISFSVYMTHAVTQVVVASLLHKLPISIPWGAGILITIGVDIFVGWMAYRIVEVPGRGIILRLFLGNNPSQPKQLPRTQ